MSKNRIKDRLPKTNGAAHKTVAIDERVSGRFTVNDAVMQTLLLGRTSMLEKMLDKKHNIDKECGYPDSVDANYYMQLYKREGIAQRVVALFPEECFSLDPSIYENEEKKLTGFETDLEEVTVNQHLVHYLHRADEISGIGRYGLILFGIDDGLKLEEPVEGVRDDGKYVPGEPRKLNYIRVFDETLCQVTSRIQDDSSPMMGQPEYYNLRFMDVSSSSSTTITKKVHWSRVIHVCDNRISNESSGQPRMEPVLNRILDLRKLLGGSAEMFWKGAFPGFSFEVDPNFAAEVELDKEELRREFTLYSSGLQRYLALLGVSAKSLAPQVADPRWHVKCQLQSIANTIGVPQRVFLGSEESRLSSSQDMASWNRRVAKRQRRYLNPMLVRPAIDRLISMRVLRKPKAYKIVWPDLNTLSEGDKAKVTLARTQAIVQFVAGGGDALIPVYQFLTKELNYTEDEANNIIKMSQKTTKKNILMSKLPQPPLNMKPGQTKQSKTRKAG